MTPKVFTVTLDDSVQAVQDLMYEKNIRHVPVVDDEGMLAGLVSDRDLLRRVTVVDGDLPLSARQELLHSLRARDVMTPDVETVDVDTDLSVVAQVMLEHKYGCLPVLEEGLLAGILTEADFVRLVADASAPDES